jgi:heme/copper-type cytochrome/quinol oxidase subunit 2
LGKFDIKLVGAVIIILGLRTWNEVTSASPKDAIQVELYSKQFDWTARYAGKDNVLGKSDFRKIGDGNDLGLVSDSKADDDVIVKGEFHLVLGKPVLFKFRSRDVIHSAYMPHFRAQMNCVPGMETTFEFTPTITTKEMRGKLNNNKFNYVLLCNKICGAAHYNMQMDIVVETQEEYNKWKSPHYPPYSPDNIADSDLICNDLINDLLTTQTTLWYEQHASIKYAHAIDFSTVMGVDDKNLVQIVAGITGGQITDDVCNFVDEYQQLNKKILLN